MPTYVHAEGSTTWHWCRNCNNYPSNPSSSERHPAGERPKSGTLCNTCKGKEASGDCRQQ